MKQITWVVQAWGKVSKEVIINSYDVCGITTDNAAKIPCLRKEHDDAILKKVPVILVTLSMTMMTIMSMKVKINL